MIIDTGKFIGFSAALDQGIVKQLPSKEAKRPSHGNHNIYGLNHLPTTNHSHNGMLLQILSLSLPVPGQVNVEGRGY